MKEIEYRCNLCRDRCVNTIGDILKPFTGIYWSYVHDARVGDRNHYISKPYREVENHICLNCLEDIHNVYLEIQKKKK